MRCLILFSSAALVCGQNVDWSVYLGNKGTTHYSPLDQINKQNVSRLREVWRHETGDIGEFQSNGLIVDGVLYTASPNRKVLALRAATGERLWTLDPLLERSDNPGKRQRGVVYWASGNRNFKPLPIGGLGQGYQGDKISITSSNNKLWPVWMDNRQIINPPTLLTAVGDTTSILLTWTDNSENELGFIIERKEGAISSGNNFIVIDTTEQNITSYLDKI